MVKRNAIIMAAGTASRFVPLSAERPKGLVEVKGEILIERQIRQLQEARVSDITVVVGYKADMFMYLRDKFGVSIVMNEDYARYNNTSSVMQVIDKLDNTFVCCSDNYFPKNVFIRESTDSYYSALYADGKTGEYCLTTDADEQITSVTVGGKDSWYMVGHVYFSHEFSEKFRKIMIDEYRYDKTRQGYWEDVYIRHIHQLPKMKVNRYKDGEIQEFDSIDELRLFDESYRNDTRSSIVKKICRKLHVSESEVHAFKNIKHQGDYLLFNFKVGETPYLYNDSEGEKIERI